VRNGTPFVTVLTKTHFMLKPVLVALAMFACLPLFAQNILSNSNFSQRNNCPWSLDQLSYCDDWRSPTKATPDYYNSCANPLYSNMSVPQSGWAYQTSNSGSYVGMYGFNYAYREYIATSSFPPLVPGGKYKVTLVISLADSVGYKSAGYGVFFYKDGQPDSNTIDRINATPQIDYIGYGMIANDTSWTVLTDTFTADSAYTNLVIGNFHHDTENLITMIKWAAGFSYYLVDSVSVEWIGGVVSTNTINNDRAPVSVFPNPAKEQGRFYFHIATEEYYNLTIYNSIGTAVKKQVLQGPDASVSMKNFSPGNYFYTMESNGNISARGHLLLE
jgi:hypothetical protein